jgi:hypothetical protein
MKLKNIMKLKNTNVFENRKDKLIGKVFQLHLNEANSSRFQDILI